MLDKLELDHRIQRDDALLQRRDFLSRASELSLAVGWAASLTALSGCADSTDKDLRMPDLVWGRKARTRVTEGMFHKPRALVIDSHNTVFVVDMMGRVQAFDAQGRYLLSWELPLIARGKPTGLGLANDGSVMVADTHYFRVLFYSPTGQLNQQRTIGGEYGDNPGQFHFVTDVCQDQRGHFFVGQYGQIDQIQEFSPDGHFVRRWGKQGRGEGEFARPQGLSIDDQQLLWVVDAHNHRIIAYRLDGPAPEKVIQWGVTGDGPGQLRYPYCLDFDRDGTVLVAEMGNHRVQRFTREGKSLEVWGQAGNRAGEMNSPWALALNSQRQLYVLDSLNHRVQRFDL